ncbi:MAG: ABC transporter ATP-binding protein [Propionibacteriaceae bacterium]|nr:ABC transporter ATP-binding protein [Propionibacteriaceae bacterium]
MIIVKGLEFSFSRTAPEVLVLKGINAQFESASIVSIMGPSGSGKSTLLNCLSGLLPLSSGSVTVDGLELRGAPPAVLDNLRLTKVGYIFQRLNLVEALTALQNIVLPSYFGGKVVSEEEALDVLRRLGLIELAHRYPGEMSGGQQQRLAIARSVVQRRAYVFADEPTGSLDRASGQQVLELILELKAIGAGVVVVTHDPWVASFADRVLFLYDGRLVDSIEKSSAAGIASRLAAIEEFRR